MKKESSKTSIVIKKVLPIIAVGALLSSCYKTVSRDDALKIVEEIITFHNKEDYRDKAPFSYSGTLTYTQGNTKDTYKISYVPRSYYLHYKRTSEIKSGTSTLIVEDERYIYTYSTTLYIVSPLENDGNGVYVYNEYAWEGLAHDAWKELIAEMKTTGFDFDSIFSVSYDVAGELKGRIESLDNLPNNTVLVGKGNFSALGQYSVSVDLSYHVTNNDVIHSEHYYYLFGEAELQEYTVEIEYPREQSSKDESYSLLISWKAKATIPDIGSMEGSKIGESSSLETSSEESGSEE